MKLIPIIIFSLITCAVGAQDIPFNKIGEVKARDPSEIEASNWGVGAETMDRDYTIYDNWKEYLGPLGVKKARLQSGWAKTEKQIGQYDFAWLDSMVYGVVSQDVEPWINICYGNPIYADGGGTRLGATMPKAPQTIDAYKKYAELLVTRYKDVVDEWEIWNEGVRHDNSMDDYLDIFVPTAEAIKAIQPEAKILGLATAGIKPEDGEEFCAKLQAMGKLHLVDEITYHPYRKNPDEVYEEVLQLRANVKKYSDRIKIRQGENGAPSEYRDTKALSKYDWTELSQAKWALRRLLGDLGRGIESSYFAIMDMNYPDEINRKGLLHATEEQTVDHVKPAYYAVQHLTSIFDNTLEKIDNYAYQAENDQSMSVFAYENKYSNQQVVTLWFDGEIPSDSNDKADVDFTFYQGYFADPVYVDLRTGEIYEIPAKNWIKKGATYEFKNIPVYDSPVLIADKSLVLMEAEDR
ncbi:MAG: GH39 family glycosyl hydrolase [Candidatus Cyclobacteriaceae bacterium M3_2C_046]